MAGDIHHEPCRHQDGLVETTPNTAPSRIGQIILGERTTAPLSPFLLPDGVPLHPTKRPGQQPQRADGPTAPHPFPSSAFARAVVCEPVCFDGREADGGGVGSSASAAVVAAQRTKPKL
ncbi:unnamed protein product, partial [Ixodes hexagonus]